MNTWRISILVILAPLMGLMMDMACVTVVTAWSSSAPPLSSSGRRCHPSMSVDLLGGRPGMAGVALSPAQGEASEDSPFSSSSPIPNLESLWTPEIWDRLERLSHLVVDWNQRLNLVSRTDCNPTTVWARHILPSLAPLSPSWPVIAPANPLYTARTVVDVGTGGGFPGLPLAVALPHIQFTLIDSVGKKLVAVQDMADTLGLTNVQTWYGRAESFTAREPFDVATGRSVADLPRFCTWMQHLLRPAPSFATTETTTSSHAPCLMYWIGGELPDSVGSQTRADVPIDHLLNSWSLPPQLPPWEPTDKRILVFSAASVRQIAQESGLKVSASSATTTTTTTPRPHSGPARGGSSRGAAPKRSSSTKGQVARGAWKRKDRSEPRQRGYEDFVRYSSSSGTSPSPPPSSS